MTAYVARATSFEPPVAVVLVDAALVQNEALLHRTLEQLLQAPELKGFAVVLAARDDDGKSQGFYGPPALTNSLQRLGWHNLSFREEQLTVQDWSS
jgi:hypothetical protein